VRPKAVRKFEFEPIQRNAKGRYLSFSPVHMTMFNVFCCVLLLTLICLSTAHPAAHPDHHNFRNILLTTQTINSKRSPAIHEDVRHQARVDTSPSGQSHQYLVRVVATATDAEVKRIETELNTSFKAYFPHHTYLMYAPDEVAHQASGVDGIEWVGSFHPEYKNKIDNGTSLQAAFSELTFFSKMLGRTTSPIVELQVSLVPNTFSKSETAYIAAQWLVDIRSTQTKISAASAGLVAVLVPGNFMEHHVSSLTLPSFQTRRSNRLHYSPSRSPLDRAVQ
jgi:hypothetical protein